MLLLSFIKSVLATLVSNYFRDFGMFGKVLLFGKRMNSRIMIDYILSHKI